jgi:hypothetical protein
MVADGIGDVVLAGLAFLRRDEASYGITFLAHGRRSVIGISGHVDVLDVRLDGEMSDEHYEDIL